MAVSKSEPERPIFEKDLNFFPTFSQHLDREDALCELITNAYDADPDITTWPVKITPATIFIRNHGKAIERDNFAFGPGERYGCEKVRVSLLQFLFLRLCVTR